MSNLPQGFPLSQSLSQVPTSSGVYVIYCSVNEFIYIGSAASKEGFKRRFFAHRAALRKGCHHSAILQSHYQKHGESVFSFHIVELCPPENCLNREQAWLNHRGVGYENRSYNINPTAGSQLGFRHSEESKAKISESQRGKPGRPVTPELREQLRNANLGKKYSPEVRAKVAAASAVRRHTDEAKGKISQANSQRVWQDSSKEKIAEANSVEFIATTPDGQEIWFKNLARFCRENGLIATQMINVAQAKHCHHKGWLCRYATESREDHLAKLRKLRCGKNL